MIWLYRFIFPFLFIFLSPYYIKRMLKRGGYGAMMKSRFGDVPEQPKTAGKKRVWIQAVSVGELLALETLLKKLAEDQSIELYLSTTTSTGYSLAQDKYADVVDCIFGFPLDFWWVSAKAWNRIQPDLAIVTEGELWPEHIQQAKSRQIPILLVNARISDRSFRRLQKQRIIFHLLYSQLTYVGVSSRWDEQRLTNLGLPESKIRFTGNLKFDAVSTEPISKKEFANLWSDTRFSNKEGFTLIGASTWPGEEELLLEALTFLRQQGLSVQLILVPRHAERRAEIQQLLEQYPQLKWHFRSTNIGNLGSEDGDVYMADTTGELRKFLQLADLAVIGKSFPPHTQGQTPVEAAALGVPMIYGPAMTNFRTLCLELDSEKAALRLKSGDELAPAILQLLQDPKQREQMIDAGKQVITRNQGSTERTLALIHEFLA